MTTVASRVSMRPTLFVGLLAAFTHACSPHAAQSAAPKIPPAPVAAPVAAKPASPPALAWGQAEGSVTADTTTTTLRYAYATREVDENHDGKGDLVLYLTDRPLRPRLLGHLDEADRDAEHGSFNLLRLNVSPEGDVTLTVEDETFHGTTIGKSAVVFTIGAISDAAVEASSHTSTPRDVFEHKLSYDVRFKANLGANGVLGENPYATAALDTAKIELADGQAAGTFTSDRHAVKLAHAYAWTEKNPFNRKQTDTVVLLTDAPIPEDAVGDEAKLRHVLEPGTVHAVITSIGSDEVPYALQLYHGDTREQISSNRAANFEATGTDGHVVEGKLSRGATQVFPYAFDASFRATVKHIENPRDFEIDATNGQPLPKNGGDPARAYLAYDKLLPKAQSIDDLHKAGLAITSDVPSGTEAAGFIRFLKATRARNLHYVGGYTDGDRATLSVAGVTAKGKETTYGAISMMRLDGAWQMVHEDWSNVPPVEPSPPKPTATPPARLE